MLPIFIFTDFRETCLDQHDMWVIWPSDIRRNRGGSPTISPVISGSKELLYVWFYGSRGYILSINRQISAAFPSARTPLRSRDERVGGGGGREEEREREREGGWGGGGEREREREG